MGNGTFLTIDVKGVAGKHDWLADNVPTEVRERHFVVFVSFEGRFTEPSEVPSVWVVPHAEVERFRVLYPNSGRSNVSRAKVTAESGLERNRWEFLLEHGLPDPNSGPI